MTKLVRKRNLCTVFGDDLRGLCRRFNLSKRYAVPEWNCSRLLLNCVVTELYCDLNCLHAARDSVQLAIYYFRFLSDDLSRSRDETETLYHAVVLFFFFATVIQL